MKKLFIFLAFLLLPLSSQASDDYDWNDFSQSCFTKTFNIYSVDDEVLKVEVPRESDLFFVQNDALLPNKVFDYGTGEYIEHDVVRVTGASYTSKDISYLNDGNLQTSLYFNPYAESKKGIIIDAREILTANSFSFKFDYKGDYAPHYHISKDGTSYIEVENVENYDFRYLKLIFSEHEEIPSKKLSIRELGFLRYENYTYLVKSNSTQVIRVFADYKCEDIEKVHQAINFVGSKTRNAVFGIDANTKEYKISFNDNRFYNSDIDRDTILNDYDNCPFVYNKDQVDSDADFVGDECDLNNEVKNFHEKDSDKDGVGDSEDNCLSLYNPQQLDSNADKKGDLCSDDDKDGVIGYLDNCINVKNKDQADINVNSIGDACEFDKDEDGVFDGFDNCITSPNPNQIDEDNDDIGDICDNCNYYNPRQIDKNNDGVGDRCEEEKRLEQDRDSDGILNEDDNCQDVINFDQKDKDKDGIGDKCDNCIDIQNSDQKDENENGVGDLCEDEDGDNVVGYLDNCPKHKNTDQSDQDNDGVGDMCEDEDGDKFVAAEDNCPFDYNKDQSDVDKDGVGDKCDEKDDRFIESNKELFFSFIIVIVLVFSVLIFFMLKKIKNDSQGEGENEKNNDEII